MSIRKISVTFIPLFLAFHTAVAAEATEKMLLITMMVRLK